MKSISALRGRLPSLRSFLSECYFLTTPIGGSANPFELVNDSLVRSRALTDAGPLAKRAAYTACEQAQSLCKHVTLAARNNPEAWRTPLRSASQNDDILKLALQIAANNTGSQN